MRLKEAIDHGSATVGGQVERQTLGAERRAYLRQDIGGFGVAAVDLVDDHQPAEPSVARKVHQALRDSVRPARRADDDRDRFHRLQHGKRAPEEIRIPRCIQEMDACRAAIEAQHGGLERVLQLPLLRIEIRHGVTARQAPFRPDGARLQQQALSQQCLARAGRSDQRDISDARGRMAHESLPRQRVAAVSGGIGESRGYSPRSPICSPAR